MEAMITFNNDDGFAEAVVRGYKTQGSGECIGSAPLPGSPAAASPLSHAC